VNRWTNVKLIWMKELRSLKRDKKALLTIFLPILIYPVIMMFFFGVSSLVEGNLGEETRRIAYVGTVSSDIQEVIESVEKIQVVDINNQSEEIAINESIVDVIIKEIQKDDAKALSINYNSTIDSSNRGKNLVLSLLKEHKEKLILESVQALDYEQSVLELVSIETIEVTEESSTNRVIASVLGVVAPFILIMYSVIGIYSITSDLSAGEKERFTLETIFSVPVPKEDIIIGKLFAGVSVGLLSGITNILSMFPIAYAIASMIPDISVSFNPLLPVYILIMLLPVMFLACAVMLGCGLFAKTYQEAQTYGAFVMMAFMLPGYIGMVPDIEYSTLIAFLPVTNAMLAMREAFIGDFPLLQISITLVFNCLLSVVSIALMAKVFTSESVIFGSPKTFFLKRKSINGGAHE